MVITFASTTKTVCESAKITLFASCIVYVFCLRISELFFKQRSSSDLKYNNRQVRVIPLYTSVSDIGNQSHFL